MLQTKVFRKLSSINPSISILFFLNEQGDDCFNYQSLNDLLIKYPKEVLLKNVLEDDLSYEFLKEKFLEAERGGSNDYFAKTIKISNRYSMELQNNEIVLYTFQGPFIVHGSRVFEWDYPSAVYRYWKANGRSIDQIINDFNNMNTIDFFVQYLYNMPIKPLYDIPAFNEAISKKIAKKFEVPDARFYSLNDSIGVGIGSGQMCFFLIEDKNILIDSVWYISDTWWYTDKQLLYRLKHWSIKKFGMDTKAGWECPTIGEGRLA